MGHATGRPAALFLVARSPPPEERGTHSAPTAALSIASFTVSSAALSLAPPRAAKRPRRRRRLRQPNHGLIPRRPRPSRRLRRLLRQDPAMYLPIRVQLWIPARRHLRLPRAGGGVGRWLSLRPSPRWRSPARSS